MPWAIKWRSDNRLDGRREHLLGVFRHPCRTMLFHTRDEARNFIEQEYGYIRKREDLQAEPHGWKMPKAVRVEVVVREVAP